MKQRRCPKIQLCPKCGQMRVHHARGYYDCDVPDTVLDALRGFRKANGTRWKSILCNAWMKSEDLGPLMQQARNMIGPRRLYKIDLDYGVPKRLR